MVDLKRRQTISNGWIASRAGWTPYDGVAVTGWPVGTFVRGRKVMWENELLTPAQGEAVRFRGDARGQFRLGSALPFSAGGMAVQSDARPHLGTYEVAV